MADSSTSMGRIVRTLLPMMSRSLDEQFNVFRVMHHGTHEKQLSNVFAWLLTPDASHDLGDAFQKIFLEQINGALPDASRLPPSGYRVIQEIATDAAEASDDAGADIADIVLSRPDAAVVVENFGTSDGHGHDYWRYLAHGTAGDRPAVVVLLCQRNEPHLQKDGWERAVVVTYAELLRALMERVDTDRAWRRRHPDQHFFVQQMFQHLVEGPTSVNVEDTVAFISTMCETGESARYGHRPRDLATQEFVDLIAEHARRQLADSRRMLASVKTNLRTFSRSTLITQVNDLLPHAPIEEVVTRFVGKWEWCVELRRADPHPDIFMEFGPTAVVEQERLFHPFDDPDYSRIFISRRNMTGGGISNVVQSAVGLADVIHGLSADDHRLRDEVLRVATAE